MAVAKPTLCKPSRAASGACLPGLDPLSPSSLLGFSDAPPDKAPWWAFVVGDFDWPNLVDVIGGFPPELVQHTAARFERLTESARQQLLGVSLPPPVVQQARLPFQEGGLGFRHSKGSSFLRTRGIEGRADGQTFGGRSFNSRFS